MPSAELPEQSALMSFDLHFSEYLEAQDSLRDLTEDLGAQVSKEYLCVREKYMLGPSATGRHGGS